MKSAKTFFMMLISLFVTLFILLNSYEIVFGKDIKYVPALGPVNLQSILTSYTINPDLDQSVTFNQQKFGKPQKLVISGKKIEIIPSFYGNDTWLSRTNTGNYSFINLGDGSEAFFTYLRKSFRTIDDINNLKTGDNITVDTNQNWRFLFRIEDLKTLSQNEDFIIEADGKPKLVILVQDTKSKINYIITAKYITTEKVYE